MIFYYKPVVSFVKVFHQEMYTSKIRVKSDFKNLINNYKKRIINLPLLKNGDKNYYNVFNFQCKHLIIFGRRVYYYLKIRGGTELLKIRYGHVDGDGTSSKAF